MDQRISAPFSFIQWHGLWCMQSSRNMSGMWANLYLNYNIFVLVKNLSYYWLTFVSLLFWLQKVSRKLRLSKTKNTKFNDSGTLLPFYFFFAAWGADIVVKVKCFYSVERSTADLGKFPTCCISILLEKRKLLNKWDIDYYV